LARILVAEDERDVRENLVELLRCEGHEVEASADGRQCVEKALQNPPDLILCDVVMPKMNGLDVIQRLRTDMATADVPFIFLTAKGARQDYRAAMDRGADDYLVKPFAASELLQAIDVRLDRAKLHRERFHSMARSLSSTLEGNLLGEALTQISGLCDFAESLAQFHPAMGKSHIFQVANDIQGQALQLRQLVEDFAVRTCLEAGSIDFLRQHDVGSLSACGPLEIDAWLRQTVGQWARLNDLQVIHKGTGSVENALFLKKICEALTEAALWVTAPGIQVLASATIEANSIMVQWQWEKPDNHDRHDDLSGMVSAQSKIRFAEQIVSLLDGIVSVDFENCQLRFEIEYAASKTLVHGIQKQLVQADDAENSQIPVHLDAFTTESLGSP